MNQVYANACSKVVRMGVTSFGTLDEGLDKLAAIRSARGETAFHPDEDTRKEVAKALEQIPLLQSLLYDLDLLPEQITDKRRYQYMLCVIGHMKEATRVPERDAPYANDLYDTIEKLVREAGKKYPDFDEDDFLVKVLAVFVAHEATKAIRAEERRICTCPPGERPVPCQRKYALNECRAAAIRAEGGTTPGAWSCSKSPACKQWCGDLAKCVATGLSK